MCVFKWTSSTFPVHVRAVSSNSLFHVARCVVCCDLGSPVEHLLDALLEHVSGQLTVVLLGLA